MPNAIVIVLDGLGTGCLGPYGNTWVDTPAWNRLACQSLVCEQVVAESGDLETLYRSYWRGAHAVAPDQDGVDLVGRIRSAGISTVLLSDERRVLDHSSADAFGEQIEVPTLPISAPANDIGQTHLARVLAAAVDWLEQCDEPFLLWLHARALSGPWDAPLELRRQFADEGDPIPDAFVEPPQRELAGDIDPDELLVLAHSYAGQVVALDHCLGVLLDTLATQPWFGETTVHVTGARGYPLGEHRRVGLAEAPLFAELLHVPWLIRSPDADFQLRRSQTLWQSSDLHATLADGFDIERSGCWGRSALDNESADDRRRAAISVADDELAVRTPGWFFRVPPTGSPQLFAKPDDRFEVNEIADRCDEAVELLERQRKAFVSAARHGDPGRLEPLDDLLVFG